MAILTHCGGMSASLYAWCKVSYQLAETDCAWQERAVEKYGSWAVHLFESLANHNIVAKSEVNHCSIWLVLH